MPNVNYQWRRKAFFKGVVFSIIQSLKLDGFSHDEAHNVLKDTIEELRQEGDLFRDLKDDKNKTMED